MLAVKTTGLTKKYGKYYGIDDINLAVEIGEIFGIVGPEGAGKTSLLRLLMNYLFPTAGTGNILGNNIVNDSATIKTITGYVPEEVTCYPQMKAAKYIKTAMKMHGVKNKQLLQELMQEFEIPKNESFAVMERSDLKTTGIVAALVIEPKVLLLDNVTDNLFSDMRSCLFALLKKEKEKGTTIIITADSEKEISDICDRIAFMQDGRIREIADLNAEARQGIIKEQSFDDEFEEYDEEEQDYLEDTIPLDAVAAVNQPQAPQAAAAVAATAEVDESAAELDVADAEPTLTTETAADTSVPQARKEDNDHAKTVRVKVKSFKKEDFEKLGMAVIAEERGKVKLAYAGDAAKLAQKLKQLGLDGFVTENTAIAAAFGIEAATAASSTPEAEKDESLAETIAAESESITAASEALDESAARKNNTVADEGTTAPIDGADDKDQGGEE